MSMAYPHGDPREPRPTSAVTKTLHVPLRPTDDAYITCVVCRQAGVEFEFHARTPDRRQWQGLHLRCAETIGLVKTT
jgi:hypothetical protein